MDFSSVRLCLLGCLLSGMLALGHGMPNFVAQDDLSDGRHEIRLHYDGVNAKQTSVTHEQGSERGLVLRQVSHHGHMVTLIYVGEVSDHLSVDGLSLRDCEVTSDPDLVDDFLATFRNDVELTKTVPQGSWSGDFHNVTFAHLSSETELPEYLRSITHFREIKAQCKTHHRNVRKAVKNERRAQRLQEEEQQQELTHSRKRRWVLNELLIMPGTKWCGNSHLADSYSDLSGYVGADQCCRAHDHCPINIRGLSKKYGLYNSRLTTVSHCACDERFRACLTMSGTGAADMVGHVFFNVVKTRCFVFEEQKVCTDWSWWGRCKKYRIKKVAVAREAKPWKN